MEGVASLVVFALGAAQLAVIIYVVVLLRRMTSALMSIANSLWAIGKSLEKPADGSSTSGQTP